MLQTVLHPYRGSQPKTPALVSMAVAERAQANSLAVTGHIAVEMGSQLGSALTRFSRLRRHLWIDE
jgi:hypothetical protein